MKLTPEQTEKLKQIDFLREKISALEGSIKHNEVNPVNSFCGGISFPKEYINATDYKYLIDKSMRIKQAELELAELELDRILSPKIGTILR
jgi:hypothetical protein